MTAWRIPRLSQNADHIKPTGGSACRIPVISALCRGASRPPGACRSLVMRGVDRAPRAAGRLRTARAVRPP